MTTVWRLLGIVAALWVLGILVFGVILAQAVIGQRLDDRRARREARERSRGERTGWTPDDGLPPWRRP